MVIEQSKKGVRPSSWIARLQARDQIDTDFRLPNAQHHADVCGRKSDDIQYLALRRHFTQLKLAFCLNAWCCLKQSGDRWLLRPVSNPTEPVVLVNLYKAGRKR